MVNTALFLRRPEVDNLDVLLAKEEVDFIDELTEPNEPFGRSGRALLTIGGVGPPDLL